MTSNDADDEMRLDLPLALPDGARANRTRQRCRALLTRRQKRQELARGVTARVATSAAVGTLCLLYALYVADLVAKTFHFRNLLH